MKSSVMRAICVIGLWSGSLDGFANEFQWGPSGSLDTNKVRFATGELLSFKLDKGSGEYCAVIDRAGKEDDLDRRFINDYAVMLEAYPNAADAIVALFGMFCGGSACERTDYYVAYVTGGRVELEHIEAAFGFESIHGQVTNGRLSRFEVLGASSGERDELGDLVAHRLILLPGQGLVQTGFSAEYRKLPRASHPEKFLSDPSARQALVLRLGNERFRQLRAVMSGPGEVELLAGRYIVMRGCKAHDCGADRALLVIDAVLHDSWVLIVDQEARKLHRQFSSALRGAVKATVEAFLAELERDGISFDSVIDWRP